MDISSVQNGPKHERRRIRVNIRLTPSQNAFITKNNLSITKVMNEALKQLGYIPPGPEEIPEGDEGDRGRGDRIAQRNRWKERQKRKRKYFYGKNIHN